MPFSFLQRGNLSEQARQLTLTQYRPQLTLEGLVPGVDNVRHDVFLSAPFREVAAVHVALMLARYGQVEDLVIAEAPRSSGPPSIVRQPGTSRLLGPSNLIKPAADAAPKPPDPADYKSLLGELHTVSLNRAKQESNPSIDMLARVAVLQFLRNELNAQFNVVLERCKTKAQSFETGVRQGISQKAVQARERVAKLQVNKKHIIRKAGQELFQTLREVEKEKLARLRRSLFGDQDDSAYDLFLNRLLFADDVRDDYLNAEHYVMLGNYDIDSDRSSRIVAIAAQYLESIEALAVAGQFATYDAILSAPENALELVGGGTPDESTPKGKAQKALLGGWVEALEREQVMDSVIASYEVVGLLQQYWPYIHAQQLKNALVSKEEYSRVMNLLEEQGKLSPDALNQAVKRVQSCKGSERAKLAGRFLHDLMRYTRDARRLEAFNAIREKVNVISSDKLRELSRINSTLYEFLLPNEQKPTDERVLRHVILKADVRDSTTLTRTLMDRGLNPASYFSLNFYDPVNKLLAKFGASKVFIEGDAVILALVEREGEAPFCVSRICVLAREMIQIVRAYNVEAQKSGLPALDLGIGVSFQDQAPLYLMDGSTRIMISSALNESDRLSGCSKGARKFDALRQSLFNVFAFQTVEDDETVGNPDEFLLRYNVRGICLSAASFAKLNSEISLEAIDMDLPGLWGQETVRLYRGLVPVAEGAFHTIVVREGTIPHLDAATFRVKRNSERRYYEVCTTQAVYEMLEQQRAVATTTSAD